MNNIKEKNVNVIEQWINNFEQYLKNYLNDISPKIKETETKIHCRDLNYILDTILERIFKLKGIKRIRWDHDIEVISKRLINDEFKNLNCHRELYNPKNKYIHIKKYMHDLCEDIKYITDEKTEIQKNNFCNDIISRISDRRERLRKSYHSNTGHPVFSFDDKCTIKYIMTKISGEECKRLTESQRVMAQAGSTLMEQSKQDTRPAEDTEEALEQEGGEVDLSATEESDFGMDISLQLPPVEEPKLDTTYAAASLCGVSLIGAMIYKFKPFGFGSRAPGMRNGMGGYPLPHAANGDYFMDNFEYLQTSIPNNEYHLGYGPAADH
ncbi:VIR protein [Plasmodium vivax]|uniref:VIR protein n=1 Tax=Plasmodium vivax TaxID=5855 RepID=A0A1G4GSH0_PLAVI|nr:VIR protein [Plasmodium vivax]